MGKTTAGEKGKRSYEWMEWRGTVPSMTLNCSHGPRSLCRFPKPSFQPSESTSRARGMRRLHPQEFVCRCRVVKRHNMFPEVCERMMKELKASAPSALMIMVGASPSVIITVGSKDASVAWKCCSCRRPYSSHTRTSSATVGARTLPLRRNWGATFTSARIRTSMSCCLEARTCSKRLVSA